MSLDHLWAGWRSAYVSGVPGPAVPGAAVGGSGATAPGATGAAGTGQAGADCVFCRIAASGPPSVDNGVLWVGEVTFAVLNAYPYTCGHLLVLPRRHVPDLDDLTEVESAELWQGARKGVVALTAAYRPDGVNLGANLGRAAGAGIPRHLHLHAVPRWEGDTNFMTAVAGTRVLPEPLSETWERLTRSWPA